MLDRYDQDLLLDYLEGELDADRRAKLDAMLADDPQLAGLLSEMAMDRAALRSLPEAQAPGDLVHDVTKTLERRMLLDEPIDETGPIPLSRGRGLTPEPARSISWGRVVGLTGLAASVALAAGIVVITLDDPLVRTADSLASSPAPETANEVEEAAIAEDAAPTGVDSLQGVVAKEGPHASAIGDDAEGIAADLAAASVDKPKVGLDRDAIARGHQPPAPRDPARPDSAAPELDLAGDDDAELPIDNFAFGSTAAISVIQPSQQLVLLTESPEVSLEQLFEFCVANGIPIVQPDEHAKLKQAEPLDINRDPGAIEEATASKDADETYGDYALLINESQLDTLVQSLNNDVTLEPSRAGKASLFSNQAAVLAELPEETSYRYGAVQARQARVVEEESVDDDQADVVSPERSELVEQQAVQLRLPPDLGSDYANSRNAYNLEVTKQQGAYAQPATDAGAVADATAIDDAPAPEADPLAQADQPEPALAEIESAPAEATDSEEAERALADNADPGVRAGQGNAPAGREPSIDPMRGNWLRAHLPATDTTPLLLQWRTEQSAKPTSLVPITIKRAEPDKVNTLRKRQQVELASRRDAKTKADAQAAEADEQAETEPAVDAAPPVDGTAKPAE